MKNLLRFINKPLSTDSYNMVSHAKNCKGFTLVEAMIGSAIGIFLLAGVLQIFTSMQQASTLVEHSSQIQETGRFAMNLITADLRRAGYWGGNADNNTISGTEGKQAATNTCPIGTNQWGRMIEQRIFGLNDTSTGYACISNNDYLRGDVLTVRFTSSLTANVFDPSDLYLRASLFEGRLFVGSKNADSANEVEDNPQRVHLIKAHAYYVGNTGRSCKGNQIPGLFWENLVKGIPQKEELLAGVEQLQVQYGIDQDLDGVVDQYFNADAVANWKDVVTVKLWLLVRAECPDNSYTDDKTYIVGDQQYTPGDSYYRQLFNQTITLRNILE